MPKRIQATSNRQIVPIETIERRIFLIRRQKVMLDSDLAQLYQTPTFRLNEAVKRNRKRFPEDFMFQLSKEEAHALTSQYAMSKTHRGGRRTRPYAFTEHGVAMLSSILNSDRAVQMNILIIRAFIRLRDRKREKLIDGSITDMVSRRDTRAPSAGETSNAAYFLSPVGTI
jgi:hypothetical protein